MKRANLSLNTIVIATIAVLVLVVLSFIFIRGSGTANTELLSCTGKGGECTMTAESCNDKANSYVAAWQCPKNSGEDIVCCIDKEKAFGLS